ncbi:MAG: copper homeostasis periplasmic binding protein CopC [Paucibacter sp.]|nr:copper homeostasis periplasmic binding protein CopC [Roseateles sp.]
MKNLLTLSTLALATSLATSPAFAHAKLQSSNPADGAALATAPTELRLKYNEPVEIAMSSIKLIGPGNAAVVTDKIAADPRDDKALVQPLPKLAPGEYRVQWNTMGRDGHHTKGEIRFTVK